MTTLFLLATPAHARDCMGAKDMNLTAMDANADGAVTPDEFAAAYPGEDFILADLNRDGVLDVSEVDALSRAR
ncbi:MAG: hypothetical protein JKP92_06130 [Alphaproteobacteria bacterium]|nr:hypothetical protein [Alphaproteobacteria bacterium]